MLRESFFYLNRLRTAIVLNDKKAKERVISNFLKNPYAGFSKIISELNDFKETIDETNKHYKVMMNYMPNSLDHELTTKTKLRQHISKLNQAHSKQKEVFINITKCFIKLNKTK